MKTFLLAFVLAATFHAAVGAADAPVGDSVATPPIIQGYVTGLALDTFGNRYVTGSFSDSQDFNPGVGADVKTSLGWSDLFVTRFNADGSYAWTRTVGVLQGSTVATAVTFLNNTLYVCGDQYVYTDPLTLPPGAVQRPSDSAIVVAFDATTGALKSGFGLNGVARYSGLNGASGLGIAAAGSSVVTTGVIFPDYSQNTTGVNPQSKTFVWSLDSSTGTSVSGFGNAGVVVLDGVTGDNSGRGIAVADGAIFVTGSLFDYIPFRGIMPLSAASNTSTAPGASLIRFPIYNGTRNAFIASLSASTGALNTNFANAGIKLFGGTDAASGNGLAVSGGNVYITGSYTKQPATPLHPARNYYVQENTDAFVLALNENSGIELSSFGTAGVVFFGRQFYDEGIALAVSGGTVYVTGGYGNLTTLGGYFYPLANGVAPTAKHALAHKSSRSKNGAPPPINSISNNGATPNNNSNSGIVNGFGIPNSMHGGSNGVSAALLPFGGYGGGGISDAFVLALDATSGARKTSFSGDGLQTFGGSDSDGGVAIAVGNGNVNIAGYCFSTDAGVGGLGKIDATGFNSFLLTLDAATGGGGGIEANTAPIVHAGDAQTARIPQFPDSTFTGNSFQAYLSPTVIDDGLPNPPGTITVKWSKLSGPGDVTFDNATNAFTGVNFSIAGTYVLQLTASDSLLSGSDTTAITVTQNTAPVIDSPATASPSPATTGQDVAFTVAAHDPDGDSLNYFWEYGDDNYDYDSSTTHAYQAPGTYTVKLHVDDDVDEVLSTFKIVVTGDPIFQVDDLEFIVDFSGKGHSSMRVAGVVGGLPSNFSPLGAAINLNSGGVTASFMLDKHGNAKTPQGSFMLQHKKGGWSFSAKLNSAAISTPNTVNSPTGANNALGLASSAAKNVAASVPVSLAVGPLNFSGTKVVNYSTKNGMARGH